MVELYKRPKNFSSPKDNFSPDVDRDKAPVASSVSGGTLNLKQAREASKNQPVASSASGGTLTQSQANTSSSRSSSSRSSRGSSRSQPVASSISGGTLTQADAQAANSRTQSNIQRNVIIAGPSSGLSPSTPKERFESNINQNIKGVADDFRNRINTNLKSLESERESGKIIGGSPAGLAFVSPRGVGVAGAKAISFLKQSNAGAKISRGTSATFNAIRNFENRNIATKFGVGVAKGAVELEAIRFGSDVAAKSTLTQDQRIALQQADINRALGAGFAGQAEDANKGGFKIPKTDKTISLKGIANELNPIFGSRDAFEQSVRIDLELQGLSGKQLEDATNAALKLRKSRSSGELLQQLNVGRRAEQIGRFGISQAFGTGGEVVAKKSFGKIAARTIPSFGIAGFSEGFGGSQAQQRFRAEQRDFQSSIKAGTLGAGSAIVLGTPIAGFALSQPRISKAINLGANIIDPLEKPSDLLADANQAISRQLIGTTTQTPIFAPTQQKQVFNFGVQSQYSPRVRVAVPTGLPDITLEASQARERGEVFRGGPPLTIEGFGSQGSKGKKGRSSNAFPSITIPSLDAVVGSNTRIGGGRTQTPTPVPQPTTRTNTLFPNIFTPTQQQTPVTVPSLDLSIGVPVTSAVAKAPPPFIPPFSLDTGGGSGRSKAKGSKFVNELEQAFSLLGGGVAQAQHKPKQSKAKSKGKQQPVNPFDQAELGFQNFLRSTAKKRRGFFL